MSRDPLLYATVYEIRRRQADGYHMASRTQPLEDVGKLLQYIDHLEGNVPVGTSALALPRDTADLRQEMTEFQRETRQELARLAQSIDPKRLSAFVEYAEGHHGTYDFCGRMLAWVSDSGWVVNIPENFIMKTVAQDTESGAEGIAKATAVLASRGYLVGAWPP